MADKSRRCHEPFHALQAFFLASVHHHQHSRGPPVLSYLDPRHGRKPDSWVGQLTFDNGLNLFPQGLTQTLPMIFGPSLLHANLLGKTDENIRNDY
jgi:hypothetical protein